MKSYVHNCVDREYQFRSDLIKSVALSAMR